MPGGTNRYFDWPLSLYPFGACATVPERRRQPHRRVWKLKRLQGPTFLFMLLGALRLDNKPASHDVGAFSWDFSMDTITSARALLAYLIAGRSPAQKETRTPLSTLLPSLKARNNGGRHVKAHGQHDNCSFTKVGWYEYT